MQPFWRDDHTIRLSLLGISLTLIYLAVLVPLGFLENSRAASADAYLRFRNHLLSPPAQIQDILLVNVDDESQRKLNQKWPWDRALFAEFIRRITPAHPKAILFDFAFLGTSSPESDTALADAIRTGPPTLVAAYLDPQGELMLPHTQFTQAGGIPALINKPLDRDMVIRRTWAAVHFPGYSETLYGIETKAAALFWKTPVEQIRQDGSTLFIGLHAVPLGRLGELPINYVAPTKAFPSLSFWQILQDSVPPDQIRNKLVIVGPNREITHDIHPTPLGRMPGMAIGANGILTILNQRYLREIPFWVSLVTGLLLVIGILQISYRMTVPAGFLATLGIVAVTVAGGFALVCRDITAEFVSPIVLGIGAWFSGFLYKHLRLAAGTIRLQRQAITDDLTGTFTARYFRLRLQEEFRTCESIPLFGPFPIRSKRPISLILAQMAPSSQLLQSQTWEEVRTNIQTLSNSLRQMLRGGDLVGHLQENRFGLLLPGAGLHQATSIAQRLHKSLQSSSKTYIFSLASSQQTAMQTGEDLLQCAEMALRRATTNGSQGLAIYDPSTDQAPSGQGGETAAKSAPSQIDYVASELEQRNQALEKALSELRQLHRRLESAFIEVTKSLVLALETKDAYTAGHLERVSRYAARLAEVLQLPPEEIQAVREAALLHDIGKIGLPDEVLHKVGKLTDEEREILRQHLTIGAKILEPMKFFQSITTLIFHHHEWYNGQGYPHGLAGDFIPAGAQIIAIADAFDAMTTQRSYNKPKTIQEALEEIRKGAGTQFNPDYVVKFIEMISQEGPRLAGYATA